MASATANIEYINEKIIPLNSENNYNPYKNRQYQPVYEDIGYKGAIAIVFGMFCRLFRANHGGVIEIKIDTISKKTKYHNRTVIRAIKQLEKDGRLIVLRHWRNSYIFVPPSYQIEDMRSQINSIILEAIEEQTRGQNVTKMETKCHQDTYIVNESYLESSIPPDPPDPPEKPPRKKQPPAEPFHNSQVKKMGKLVNSIKSSCDKINVMAKNRQSDFNIHRFVGSMLKSSENYHVRAIADTLYSIWKYNYDYIFEKDFGTWGYLRKSIITKSGEYNSYDNEKFNALMKAHEAEFCDRMKREGIEF